MAMRLRAYMQRPFTHYFRHACEYVGGCRKPPLGRATSPRLLELRSPARTTALRPIQRRRPDGPATVVAALRKDRSAWKEHLRGADPDERGRQVFGFEVHQGHVTGGRLLDPDGLAGNAVPLARGESPLDESSDDPEAAAGRRGQAAVGGLQRVAARLAGDLASR